MNGLLEMFPLSATRSPMVLMRRSGACVFSSRRWRAFWPRRGITPSVPPLHPRLSGAVLRDPESVVRGTLIARGRSSRVTRPTIKIMTKPTTVTMTTRPHLRFTFPCRRSSIRRPTTWCPLTVPRSSPATSRLNACSAGVADAPSAARWTCEHKSRVVPAACMLVNKYSKHTETTLLSPRQMIPRDPHVGLGRTKS